MGKAAVINGVAHLKTQTADEARVDVGLDVDLVVVKSLRDDIAYLVDSGLLQRLLRPQHGAHFARLVKTNLVRRRDLYRVLQFRDKLLGQRGAALAVFGSAHKLSRSLGYLARRSIRELAAQLVIYLLGVAVRTGGDVRGGLFIRAARLLAAAPCCFLRLCDDGFALSIAFGAGFVKPRSYVLGLFLGLLCLFKLIRDTVAAALEHLDDQLPADKVQRRCKYGKVQQPVEYIPTAHSGVTSPSAVYVHTHFSGVQSQQLIRQKPGKLLTLLPDMLLRLLFALCGVLTRAAHGLLRVTARLGYGLRMAGLVLGSGLLNYRLGLDALLVERGLDAVVIGLLLFERLFLLVKSRVYARLAVVHKLDEGLVQETVKQEQQQKEVEDSPEKL